MARSSPPPPAFVTVVVVVTTAARVRHVVVVTTAAAGFLSTLRIQSQISREELSTCGQVYLMTFVCRS